MKISEFKQAANLNGKYQKQLFSLWVLAVDTQHIF
jgi:hypothetical protein